MSLVKIVVVNPCNEIRGTLRTNPSQLTHDQASRIMGNHIPPYGYAWELVYIDNGRLSSYVITQTRRRRVRLTPAHIDWLPK
jgi:hypothetical protein